MSTITILSKDQCTRAIRSIGRVGAAVQARIHEVAVSALAHMRDHGDTTIATNLMDAIPAGTRREALAYWFNHFSSKKFSLKQDRESRKWVGDLAKLKDRSPEDFKVDLAYATTFADLTKEAKPGQTFTMEQLLKKLKSWANEEGTFEGTAIPKVAPDVRDAAAALVAQFDGAKPVLRIVKAA